MPLALVVVVIQVSATYILIKLGHSQLHALAIVIGSTTLIILIIFIILALAVDNHSKLYRLFIAELVSCIQELKIFWSNLTNRKK